MKFNSAQSEGLARLTDTLAASAIIGFIVGITGHSSLSVAEFLSLVSGAIVSISFAFYLRGSK